MWWALGVGGRGLDLRGHRVLKAALTDLLHSFKSPFRKLAWRGIAFAD